MSDDLPDIPVRTVFLGDSITAAADWESWFPDRETVNQGVSGDTTDDLLDRFDDLVAAEPDVVALLVGTNDLGRRKSVEHLVRNIELLLVNLRRQRPGCRTLVQSIMPRSADFAAEIRDANRHLRQFAPSVGAQYLDLWPVLAGDGDAILPEYSDDDLHLSPAGYEAWLSELRPALLALDGAPPMTGSIRVIRD